MKRVIFVALLAIGSLGSGVAEARDVYFNGVKLDSTVILKDKSFANCEVRFDSQGNIWITAKGVEVKLKPTATPPSGSGASPAPPPAPTRTPVAATLEKEYWLVAPQPSRGRVQYDIDVYINGKWVKKVKSGDDKAVLNVTRYVRPGPNEVKIIATKRMGDRRVSSSPKDVMEVIVGEGKVGGGTVMITRPVVTYRRNASETRGFSDTFRFDGR